MFWILVVLKAIGVPPLDQYSWWWVAAYIAFELVAALIVASLRRQ
jgi:hypothetical protein